MDKIVTKTGKEFQIKSIEQPATETLRFTAIGIKDYNSFIKSLDRNEISNISLYTGKTKTADYGSYSCIVYPINSAEQEDGTLDVTVTLRKENEQEATTASLKKAVDTLILSELGVL